MKHYRRQVRIGAVTLKCKCGLMLASGSWLACSAKPPTAYAPMPMLARQVASSRTAPNLAVAEDLTEEPALAPEQDYDDEPNAIGDDSDEISENVASADRANSPHPFDSMTTAELRRTLSEAPTSLGSASLGRPNAGALFNADQLPEDPIWKREDPAHAWATAETIQDLSRALHAVARRFPNTAVVSIGHLSARKGGPLRPHVSHQSGRDVDVGLYYAGGPNRWYRHASVDNLDVERTWWLIRTLVLETNIEMILLDQSLIAPVERFAIASGESREWVESVFHRRDGRPCIVRHAPGHATHLHLRFFNPVAQQSGKRLAPMLLDSGMVTAPQKTIAHVARTGETLAKLATRYSTTMQAIRDANSMRTYQLVAGTTYRIPVKGSVLDGSETNAPIRRPRQNAATPRN